MTASASGFSPYRRLNSTYNGDGHFYTPSGTDANGRPSYDVTESEVKREGGVLFDATGKEVAAYAAEQEKFKGGFMFDFSIGRYFRLRHGRSLNVNLSLQNITNNTSSAPEDTNRIDRTTITKKTAELMPRAKEKPTKFSRNSKYYYANPFNFFLNIGFKF